MDNRFERAFVEYMAQLVKKSEMTHSEFARQAWPGLPTGQAERTWRRVRSSNQVAEPRRITLSEAHSMGLAIGLDFPSLVWQVDQFLLNKEAG